MTESEAAAVLEGIKTTLSKVGGEVNKKLDELTAALAAKDAISPEVETKIGEIKSIADGLDALIPDTPVGPTPTEESTPPAE